MSIARRYAAEAERGQAIVEFIVVFPLLALFVFGIIEMGAAWRTFQITTNAAREGARLTVLPDADEAQVRVAIDERLAAAGLEPGNADVQFACSSECFGSSRPGGENAEVRISYPFQFRLLGPIASYIGGDGSTYGQVTMETAFLMRIE